MITIFCNIHAKKKKKNPNQNTSVHRLLVCSWLLGSIRLNAGIRLDISRVFWFSDSLRCHCCLQRKRPFILVKKSLVFK